MTEFTLPVSLDPNMAAGTVSQQSGTQTGGQSPPDKCQMQADALRGAMADCKRAMMRVNECQEIWFQCRHGVSLKQVGTGSEPIAYNVAISLGSGMGMIGIGLSRLELATGIKIE